METEYRISVVTVCLNDREGLRATIASVEESRLEGIQHVIKDGGSSDGTQEFLRALPAAANRRWVSTADGGIYAGMNQALALAEGEFVLMLNSGDTLEAGTLQRWIDYLAANPATDLICSNIRGKRVDGRSLVGRPPMAVRNPTLMPVWHQAALLRRDLHEKFGFYREDYRMISDMIFYHKVFPHVRSVYLDFIAVQMSAGGISELNRYRQFREFIRYLNERRAPLTEHARISCKYLRWWFAAWRSKHFPGCGGDGSREKRTDRK